jgi:hypothetical protein
MLARSRSLRWSSFLLAAACAGCLGAPGEIEEGDVRLGEADSALFGLPGSYWPINSDGVTEVPVCWLTPGYATEKGWTRSSVESQWGAYSSVAFVGWGDCDALTPIHAIRIELEDDRPESLVGRTAFGASMWLNFTFNTWDPWIQDGAFIAKCSFSYGREHCVRHYALHEFGHALGFLHEQDRPDNGEQCDKEVVPMNGDILTTYDADSIMNYCAGARTTITHLDILGLQEVYGLAHGPAAVILDSSGLVEAFVRGPNDEVWRTKQTSPGGAFSAWESLGGPVTGNPAAAKNQDGRLEVVVRGTDNRLMHKWQFPNGTFSSWVTYGGPEVKDTPVIRANQDGRLEVFARGNVDNAIWHVWQVVPNGGWSSWSSFGGSLTSGPAVGRNADGRLEVFARGADGTLQKAVQLAPNANWSGWSSLGGVLTSGPTVEIDASNRLQVFARGLDNAIHTTRQSSAGGGGWTAWSSLGAAVNSAPVVGRNQDGRLEVFARGLDDAIWHTWQTTPGGAWSGWSSRGGSFTSGLSVTNGANNGLALFARGEDKALWFMTQLGPNGSSGWQGNWTLLGSNVANSVLP